VNDSLCLKSIQSTQGASAATKLRYAQSWEVKNGVEQLPRLTSFHLKTTDR
jgi:hypothetical protein